MYCLRVHVGLPCLSHRHDFCPESTNLETYRLGNLSINLNISKNIETTRLTKPDLKLNYKDILRLCAQPLKNHGRATQLEGSLRRIVNQGIALKR